MTDDKNTTTDSDHPFLFAEECGLALFKNRKTGKKLFLEKATWAEMVTSIRRGWRPGA